MAESFDAKKEGNRIVAAYLSAVGWAKEWQRTIVREIHRPQEREVIEEKIRKVDHQIEDAEGKFSDEVDHWLKSKDPMRFEVLETIYNKLKVRNDLGYFAKAALERIKRSLPPV
ncbi:MAG: hypothetical protein KKB81_04090 [Candidatus Margulisbacteria bacterium]|nr:hypothetical protein [Candidatus Margulisiibacteriota bacterium]MBU1021925.1 hypothetical protein [Candidatus Margulisiibacteriota bacterium]MBU1728904.1 hypothetical protein [Candidatus Margulisiibacteriota bacterium]MBU1954710.1 hypothetical protein [Candidatus Margulisiibacteriota bacterium]